jgi:uncharacterized protein (DUF697 family)/putative ribosome biogenesis GTPase RsgA
MTELPKKEYLRALKKIKKAGPDRFGIAGDVIGVGMGAGAGALAAGSVAAAVGATSILGSTGLGSLLGGVVVASTPLGWVIGTAAAGGALAYGATRMIRSGVKSDVIKEGIIKDLIKKTKETEPRPPSSDNVSVVSKVNPVAFDEFFNLLIQKYESGEITQSTCEILKAQVHQEGITIGEAIEMLTLDDGNSSQEKGNDPSWVQSIVDKLEAALKSEADPEVKQTESYLNETVPTIWLLGKTGAGKSSLVAALTQSDDVKVGNGFQPCTKHCQQYAFPQDHPLLHFLDTRGLSEADYDPSEDVATCIKRAHALIVVCKVDEQIQIDIIRTLKANRSKLPKNILIVYTGCKTNIPDTQLTQSITRLQEQLATGIGRKVNHVEVDFMLDDNIEQLRDEVADMMPQIKLMLMESNASSAESNVFLKARNEVLWHSGAAGASDLAPIVGLVSVPSIQAKLMYSLAARYGVEWDRRQMAEFVSVMGAGFLGAYGTNLLARQVMKLIPGWGQTVGALSAGAVSFAATYALGRAAAYYFFAKRNRLSVDTEEIKDLYRKAFAMAQKES